MYLPSVAMFAQVEGKAASTAGRSLVLDGSMSTGLCSVILLWVKNRPNIEPGQWKEGLKPALPGGLIVTHTHMFHWTTMPMEHGEKGPWLLGEK